MNHHPDTAAIEAGIAHDRAQLAATLNALQDRVSADHLAHEALGLIRTNAASYAGAIETAARANPLAVALTGAGIAWLLLGNRKPAPVPAKPPEKPPAASRWEDAGGSLAATALSALIAADVDWAKIIDDLRAKASEALQRLEADARAHADKLAQGLTETAGTARDFAAARAAILADFADDMKQGLAQGLEDLSATARDQIAQAQARARAAGLWTEQASAATTREAGRLVTEHPLAAGAVALAVGAALAMALPRRQSEKTEPAAEPPAAPPASSLS